MWLIVQEAQGLADKSFGGKFFETSAKTTKNIDEVFHDLVRYVFFSYHITDSLSRFPIDLNSLIL